MGRTSYIPHLLCEKINDILVGDLALTDLSNVDPIVVLQKILEIDGPGSGLNADYLDNHDSSDFALSDLSNVPHEDIVNIFQNLVNNYTDEITNIFQDLVNNDITNITNIINQMDLDADTFRGHPLDDFMLKDDYDPDRDGCVEQASHALQADEATHASQADEAAHATQADEAAHASQADEASHALQADEATHATQADEASNASTLEGHPASDFASASHTHDDIYLNKSNEEAYTPVGPYNPATKKYVDDVAATRGDMFKDDYDPDYDGSVERADDALTLNGHCPVTSPTPSSIPITDAEGGYLNHFIDWDSVDDFVRVGGDGEVNSLLVRLLIIESENYPGVTFEPSAPNTICLKGRGDPTDCHILLTSNNYEVWHSGNDGPGSGLNADLLDDLEAEQLVRKDIADSVANGLLVRQGDDIDLGGRLYLQSPTQTDLLSDITIEAFSNYFRVYGIKSNGMLAGIKIDIEQREDGLHDIGDMLRSVYDPDKDGKVERADDADNLGGHDPSYYAHALGDLADVSLGVEQSMEEGQTLVFNGNNWTNGYIPGVLYEKDYDKNHDGVIDVTERAYVADDSDLWGGSAKYVFPDEPHPDVGEDGDFWFQYDCSEGAK